MTHTGIIQVAVPGPLARLFDYLPPTGEQGPVQPGMRVRVPFGGGRRIGIVVATAEQASVDTSRLRRIGAVLDPEPVVDDELLALGHWAAGYYHHPLGEVLASMLPAPLRRGEAGDAVPPPRWRATAEGEAAAAEGLARAPAQSELLRLIAAHPGGVEQGVLKTAVQRYQQPLRALLQKGFVEEAPAAPPAAIGEQGGALNPAQQAAVDAVDGRAGRFAPHLLYGVTGSGKTAVYLELARRALTRGRQVLLLVPEIGLTPQLLARFAARLPVTTAVLHSGLTDRERLLAWRSAARGEARLIVGTRSAVFVPLAEPGLIVVDEEHDGSLKQQEGFRYHGRDLAVVRAQRRGVPVVLGSATPSLESLANAHSGQYELLRLDERAGAARPPHLELIDVRRRRLEEGVSRPLLEVMEEQLASGGQILLFLNRRGWSPTLICDDCGWVAECRRCDARMTVHRAGARQRCHHCGAEAPVPASCPDCGGRALVELGHGTERIEQAIAERFPGTEAVRIDRDSTRRRGALEAKLERVRSGQARILLGTQMLAKGHDFPGVTLVGVLDADRGLFGADFRAPEHLAQTILQVAGRAGRGDRSGHVLVQTRNPDHPLLRSLVGAGYEAAAERLLAERREARLPPATHMALVRAEAPQWQPPQDCLEAAREHLEREGDAACEVFGPAPAPMERVAGRYRAQLALQAGDRRPLHRSLRTLRPWLETAKPARRVRWSIDVDPVDML